MPTHFQPLSLKHYPVVSVVAQPDGGFVSLGAWGELKFWSQERQCVRSFNGHPERAHTDNYFLVCLSDGRLVSSNGQHFKVWSKGGGEKEDVICQQANYCEITALAALSHPDSLILAGYAQGWISMWTSQGELLRNFEAHKMKVTCLCAFPDGSFMSGSEDSTVVVWGRDGTIERTFEGHKETVSCLAVSHDGFIFSGSQDRTVRMWNRETGECVNTMSPCTSQILALRALSNGNIVVGSATGAVSLWNRREECLWAVKLIKHATRLSLDILPDNRTIVLTFGEGYVDVVQLPNPNWDDVKPLFLTRFKSSSDSLSTNLLKFLPFPLFQHTVRFASATKNMFAEVLTMEKFAVIEEYQEIGCLNLYHSIGQHHYQICGSFCADVVHLAIENFPHNPTIQRYGRLVLFKLAVYISSVFSSGRDAVLDSVIPWMQTYENDQDMQLWGWKALVSLSAFSGFQVKLAKNGLEFILAKMQASQGVVDFQEITCQLVHNIAQFFSNSAILMKHGVLNQVLEAMRSYPNSLGVQEWGCRLLLQLSQTADFRIQLVEKGSIQLVLSSLAVLDSHSKRSQSQTFHYGCEYLYKVASYPESCDIIVDNDGIKVLLEFMRRLCIDFKVQEAGCRALKALSSKPENADKTVQSDGIGIVLSAVQLDTPDYRLAQSALATLYVLASSCPQHRSKMTENNGLNIVIACIKKWLVKNPRVVEYGCQIICSISGQEHDTTSDFLGLLITALRTYYNDTVLQLWCCRALYSLCQGESEGKKLRKLCLELGGLDAVESMLNGSRKEAKLKEAGDSLLQLLLS